MIERDQLLSARQARKLVHLGRLQSECNNPNPLRKGCPTDDTLRMLAFRREDPHAKLVTHITNCSPCYQRYSHHRHSAKARAFTGYCFLALLLAGLVVTGTWAAHTYLWNSRTPPLASSPSPAETHRSTSEVEPEEPRLAPQQQPKRSRAMILDVNLDFREASPLRNDDTVEGRTSPVIRASPSRLRVTFPIGSPPGTYEFGLFTREKEQLRSVRTSSRLRGGLTTAQFRMDLSSLESGHYFVGFRFADGDWLYVPVIVTK